ncbi:DUF1453 family protein [Streptomyces sp. ISL-94]|uniref:DUF1453 family protein n=1 Tax=Streptomyces sp. ISL-94 TaxID=2819190 RepID=UPI001BE5C0D8|nr:DUF1453 family protein [Streptomyces sp. ISL-94]MBT2481856.1 DUF1453 family protein [Streptomyces sp. ISL-94]
MSDAMQEALLLSGGLMAIVLLTQVGKHGFGWIKFGISMGFTVYLYWDTYDRTPITGPNITASALGILVGGIIGYFLMTKMVVYRNEQKKHKVYTKAGWAYLFIWIAVLVFRTTFLLLLENSPWFSDKFGTFMVNNDLGSEGIAAFFVLMAMTMVGYRTVVCLIRSFKLPPAPQATPAGSTARSSTAGESESSAAALPRDHTTPVTSA